MVRLLNPELRTGATCIASAPGPLLFLVLRGPGTRKYVMLGRIKLITCLSSEKFEKIGEGGRLFFFILYFFG